MSLFFLGSIANAMLGLLMLFLSVFLIMLILIQRGKGGGLTGALGGPGGQSAFGSKAGDTFTYITIVVAALWGFTCAFAMWKEGTHAAPISKKPNMTAGPGDEKAQDTNALDLSPGGLGLGGDTSLGGDTPSAELGGSDDDADSGESADASSDDAEGSSDDAEGGDETGGDEAAADNAAADSDTSEETDDK